MKYDNFGQLLVIMEDFKDKTCIFDVENNFILFFPWAKTAKITSLTFVKETMMIKVSMCCYRPRNRLKHSVSGHCYNGHN